MLAFAHVFDFFFDVFAGLGTGRLALALVLGGRATRLGFWHGVLPVRCDVPM